MRLILLGPNGQLGSDILVANSKRSVPFEIESVTRSELDVTQPRAIAGYLGARDFNALINCTSFHKTDEVEEHGGLAVAVNAAAPKALAEACAVRGARFIHISTDYVFGGHKSAKPLTEAVCPAPLNVYGATKLLGETLAFAKHTDVVVLRVASLFGLRGASGKGGNFVETMVKLGRERGSLKVTADQIMSPTATADIAGWILALLSAKAPAGLYHAVNTGAVSWYEFACNIIETCGIEATIEPISASQYPTIAMRPAYCALDNTKLAAVIGPIRGWRDALKDYLKAKGHI